ncbi:nucleotide sugar dehydrogenase [Thioalkalivibrio sp. AKL19]|uniref:nucleotide sugar dehydrogenase n=1 Tax=Thioalkalivibrio sp. AKL19 TaxID=1266914 RepID=UPI000426822D|nr:nucleotide sugar dehydrogenase [Thioalkalivibrio sp. AKL19]
MHTLPELDEVTIGVVGLGYVGLPLAVEFGHQWPTRGFDIDPERVRQLQAGMDRTREVEPEKLAATPQLTYTADLETMRECNVFVVTVPTPIDLHKRPDLGPLLGASRSVGQVLKPGDTVIFESTVYPGATEEDCVPILEAQSGLVHNRDFFTGYSPERINPGDKEHGVTSIMKVTSGSTPEVADFVDGLYARVITAGTHKAESIRVAEAAKVIENTQRDVNIALINELALLFERLGLDTEAVLKAAGTKWNFLPFRPGLVGGHCIGVDPYYLTHKAQAVGHHPEMILAGRRVNDAMGAHIADNTVRALVRKGINPVGARILVMGLTFKENCPDLRNTRVIDIHATLAGYNAEVTVFDPWVDPAEAEHEYGITPVTETPAPGQFDAIIVAVPHREFLQMGIEAIRELARPESVIFDVKSVFPRTATDLRL